MDAQSRRFSASSDGPRSDGSVDQLGPLGGEDDDDSDESEVEDNEDTDNLGHLFDLAEAAHLADVYHTDEEIVSLRTLVPRDIITIHRLGDSTPSTPNSSPQKRSCL